MWWYKCYPGDAKKLILIRQQNDRNVITIFYVAHNSFSTLFTRFSSRLCRPTYMNTKRAINRTSVGTVRLLQWHCQVRLRRITVALSGKTVTRITVALSGKTVRLLQWHCQVRLSDVLQWHCQVRLSDYYSGTVR